MIRREFFQRITVAGASGLAAVAPAKATQGAIVRYNVKGFSCVTCAIGLEVMLREQKGVLRAKASYQKALVSIEFDPVLVTETTIKSFIAGMGFVVSDAKSPS